MKNKRILYIGNNLSKKSKYKTSIAILSELLDTENFEVTVVSNKTNKLIRLLDMLYKTFFLEIKLILF